MLDLVLRGARVFDGRGGEPFRADVGVRDGRIGLVGRWGGEPAARRVDCDGLALAPGFIDMHSHADLTLPAFPRARNSVEQGVTTEVVGNCGFTAAPVVAGREEELRRHLLGVGPYLDYAWRGFGEYLEALEQRGPAVNVAPLVGHGTLRLGAVGMQDRPARPDEQDTMAELLRQALRDGAWGMSSGLVYAPGTYGSSDELIALGRVLSERDGLYFSHIRGEGPTLLKALEEAATIGERAGIRVQVSHLKASSQAGWGKMPAALESLEAARTRGVRLHADAYPYTAGSTFLSQLLPRWAFDGGNDALLARLRSTEQRARMRAEMEQGAPTLPHPGVGFDQAVITGCVDEKNRRWQGQSVSRAAEQAQADPYEFLFDLLREERGGTVMVLFIMQEPEVRQALAWSYTAIGSDQLGVFSDTSPVHPRAYGTFVRVLGRYARDEALFSLAEAIRKMTGLPASILGLADRGLVREGFVADLVLFDPTRVADRSTYEQPTLSPAGVEMVLVNGRVAVEAGRYGGDGHGKVLRAPWAEPAS